MLSSVPEDNCTGLHPDYRTPEHLVPAKRLKAGLVCVSSFQETQKFLMLSYFTCIKRRANKTTLELLKVIFCSCAKLGLTHTISFSCNHKEMKSIFYFTL